MKPSLEKTREVALTFQVELICDEANWSAALSAIGEHDFTHTFNFHHISMTCGEGEPWAFVARDDAAQLVAMWPVLRREIDGTNLFDFTSVYGYAGPILSAKAGGSQAVTAILGAMRASGAVSLFSRMHPLFSSRLDEGIRGVELGEVVVIDVGTNEDVLAGYRGSHRREIVNARAKGVVISVESGEAAIAEFHNIYCQAMNDLRAKDYYFFGRGYLNSLETSSDFRTLILFAELDGRKIAASMFIVTGSLMQYYLSGTVSEFRRLAPSKMIIAEAHRLAIGMGLSRIILGGGVGSGHDPLLAFKKGFSSLTLPFYVPRRVLNDESYVALCAARRIIPSGTQFFPAYRAESPKVS